MGERCNRTAEVRGSNPLSSTSNSLILCGFPFSSTSATWRGLCGRRSANSGLSDGCLRRLGRNSAPCLRRRFWCFRGRSQRRSRRVPFETGERGSKSDRRGRLRAAGVGALSYIVYAGREEHWNFGDRAVWRSRTAHAASTIQGSTAQLRCSPSACHWSAKRDGSSISRATP